MKKILLLASIVLVGVVLFLFLPRKVNEYKAVNGNINQTEKPVSNQNKTDNEANENQNVLPEVNSKNAFNSPLDRPQERITKKHFGIFITPSKSPVQLERFRGYHTGVDFEIFPEELDLDVAVKAVCDGKILEKRTATGYGGILVQSCKLDSQDITVVYGHLSLSSVNLSVGDKVNSGEKIGILGKEKSVETSGERKHLHLGFHRGKEINIRGYVENEKDLSDWIDPCLYVCR